MAFIQYAMQIIMSFLMITAMSIMLPRANVSARRINEVLETEVSVQDPEDPVQPSQDVKGTVEFDHVSFAYPEAGENVITDISFKAEKGETVAIIGSTGSGKSTLINLIPRFYDATEGSVKVDGVDVRKMTQKDVRDRIGYVPQKGILFSGTIDSNIRYGKTEISEDAVKKAAGVAQATEFIDTKPERYKTPIAQEEAMFPVDRSRGFPLPELSQKIRRSLSLMTAFPHWIQNRQHTSKSAERTYKRSNNHYRGTAYQYDLKCR